MAQFSFPDHVRLSLARVVWSGNMICEKIQQRRGFSVCVNWQATAGSGGNR